MGLCATALTTTGDDTYSCSVRTRLKVGIDMPSLPPLPPGARESLHIESNTRLLCDLLDTLIAIRMDVGHGPNGVAASPDLGPDQLRGIRLMLDHAITSAKGLLGSIECPPPIE